MKLNEFLVQVFGSERSNEEFEQLGTWKEEGELNAKHLQEMSLLNSISNDLNGYQSFDVEAALNKTIPQLQEPARNNSIKYIALFIGLIALSFTAFFTYNHFKKTETTYIASTSIQETKLDDGTVFHLNQESTLTFDKNANHMNLKGEAFFDVAKQEVPLMISTTFGDIKVLGTSFNVISNEKYTEIYMFSGEIAFISQQNETLNVSKNQGIKVFEDRIERFDSQNEQVYNYWLNKELVYISAPLTNVLDDLERLYNKDYSELKSQANKLSVTANFKNNSLEEITQELQVITGIKF